MTGLIRDPAEWATESGWVSRLRAERAAARLRDLARIMDVTFNAAEDDGIKAWVDELNAVAKYLAPKEVPA